MKKQTKTKTQEARPTEPDFDQEGAEQIIRDLSKSFPGLFDGKTDVNGGDLVDFLTERLDNLIVDCGHEEDDEKEATFTYCGSCGRVHLDTGGG